MIIGNIVLVLDNPKTRKKEIYKSHNIVTTAGNLWYAQVAGGDTPDNAFVNLYLATGGNTPPAIDDNYSDFSGVTGEDAPESGYPMSDCQDADNTGAGTDVVSWEYNYTAASGAYTAIQWCFISIAGASGTDPILCSYKWAAAWTKDTSTPAKIFLNHTVLGG